jgi:hypothetical protein
MKRFALYALTIAALVGAGVAFAASSPSAKLDKQDRVYGGGQFGPGCFSNSTVCFQHPRNFAVDAHAQGDGSEAVGNSTYGPPGGFESYRNVTCLRVEGNKAAIGGLITSGANAGYGYVEYFVDRGGPGLGDRDLASPEFEDPLELVELAGRLSGHLPVADDRLPGWAADLPRGRRGGHRRTRRSEQLSTGARAAAHQGGRSARP